MGDLDMRGQVLHPDGLQLRQRTVFMHDQAVGKLHDQFACQVLVLQHLPEIFLMLGGVPEDAQVIPYLQDISHSLQHVGFLVKDLCVVLTQRPGKMGKRVGDVAGPRGGNGKALAGRFAGLVHVFHVVHLLQDLPGPAHKLLPFRGQDHAVGAALEYSDPQVSFQFLDHPAQVGLGHMDFFRRLVDGAVVRNAHSILQVQNVQAFISLTGIRVKTARKPYRTCLV